MARQFSRAERRYAPGLYGPFVIDGRLAGDTGAVVTLTRVAWPGDSNTPVVTLLAEYLYGTVWSSAASAVFNGGVQIDRFTGAVVAASFLSVGWPEHLVDGQLVPNKPDAIRLSATVHLALDTAVSLTWR